MIPVSGGAGDDNSDGDFCSSSSSRSNNNNQRLLKEAIRSCDSSPATAHLERILDESSRQSDHVDDDDETLLQIKPRTEASPELALSHSSPLTLPTDSTLTRNSNLISNGNNNNNKSNNNRVHVDDNYNYQQQHHTTICTEQEEQQHQLNNNHHHYNQQQLLYNTGDSNSYQEEEEEEQYHNHPGDLSESLSSLYLPTLSRQLGTTIMSGLNWINQIDFNNLLQSLVNPSSIFRRRNSATPIISPHQGKPSGASHNGATLASPLSTTTTSGNGSSTTTTSLPQLQPYSSSTLQTKLVAKMLNGALLKPHLLRQSQEETIELESFGVVELDNDESGIGHDFQRYENDKPTWCDACAEFLTPPVMNDSSGGSKANANDAAAAADSEASTFNNNHSEGKTTSTTTAETATTTATAATTATSTSAPVAVQTDHLMRTYLQCRRCAYVCHLKCTPIIRINCRPAVSAVASGSPPDNYRRRSSAGNPSSRRSQRLQRNSVRFDGGSLFPLEAKQQQQQQQPTKELRVQEEEENRPSKEMNHIGEQEEEEGKSSQPSSNLSSPEDSSQGFEEDGGYPMSTSVTMSSIATEDDLLAASSLPTDTASVFVDSRTLEDGGGGGGGVTEDEDATLCDESSSGENSTAADLPPNDDVTFTLVNGQQPNLEAAAAQQVQQVDSRTYTKKMQQQQQNSKSLQSAAAELLTPASITELRGKILRYNERIRGRGSGLGITLIDEAKQLFRGFLRVHMNLTRPINVIAGKRPPSIYDIINEEEGNNPNNPNLNQQQQQRRTLTSFYMPRDTVKNIHITSESTSLQVIKAMLKKFKVVDNPQKFALYLRRRFPEEELQQQQAKEEEGKVTSSSSPSPTKTEAPEAQSPPNRFEQAISNFLTPSAASGGYEHSLKRLADQERPLVLQLEFDSLFYGAVDIVLQENDNADIAWDAFEAPELCNFLKILDREEAEHLEHVRSHFVELKRVMRALVELEERKCRGGAVDIPHPRASLPLSSGGGADKTDTNSPAAVPVGS